MGARKQNKDVTGIRGDGLKFVAPTSSSMHFVKTLEDGIIVLQCLMIDYSHGRLFLLKIP